MLKLVIATPSPYARKAHIALLEKHIACEIVVDNPWLPDAQAAAHNPLGKIPILILDDARVLHDSKVIVEYVDSLGGAPNLLPQQFAQRIEHKQIEALADGVCDAVGLSVLERTRPAERQSADWIARQRAKIEAGVAQCEQLIGGNDYFVDERFGLADISVGCMLGYLDLRMPEFNWRAAHLALTAFFARVAARASFAATTPRAQQLPQVR